MPPKQKPAGGAADTPVAEQAPAEINGADATGNGGDPGAVGVAGGDAGATAATPSAEGGASNASDPATPAAELVAGTNAQRQEQPARAAGGGGDNPAVPPAQPVQLERLRIRVLTPIEVDGEKLEILDEVEIRVELVADLVRCGAAELVVLG